MNAATSNRALPWLLWATFLAAAALLFTGLGHYPLWDDEAMDGLSAQSILQTGDTTARVGHNLVAYRNGLLLAPPKGDTGSLRIGMPPLTAYGAAVSMRLFGQSAWAARLPSVLCGLACVGLMLWWLWQSRVALVPAAVFAIALLGNVSFFLYARQCRYYGVSMLLFTAIAYLYLHEKGRRGRLLALGGCAAALMAANPMFFVLLSGCLLGDYLIWQRKVRRFKAVEWAIYLAPQVIVGCILLAWWNPLQTQQGGALFQNTLRERALLLWWNLRDLNNSEMILGVLLVAAPWVAFAARNVWLKRALCAFVIYFVGLTLLSPQILHETTVADVRYLSAILPLCIAIEALTLCALFGYFSWPAWVAIPSALLLFGTNSLHGGPFFREGLRSTLVAFVGEEMHPNADPYTVTIRWINEHVREGQSIWVLPEAMTYPLIFHAPKAVYAWQLQQPVKERFATLPRIHFYGAEPPDYIILFGPLLGTVEKVLENFDVGYYEEEAILPVFWRDLYRPEIIWRCFTPVTQFKPTVMGITILKRKPAPMR